MELKFKLGDIVRHASSGKSGDKMIVISRGVMESQGGKEGLYMVSGSTFHQGIFRANYYEVELTLAVD